LDQEIGELNREKNAITRPVSQIPGYATGWNYISTGRLKMREWKMRHGHNCRGGTCRSGKCRSTSQGWKMQEWKMREQTAGVENVEVSAMYRQPENKLRRR